MALLPVETALAQVLDGAAPVDAEEVPVAEAASRVLARDLAARRTQPPFDASAMDGYAVRAADTAQGARLRLVGESAAGRRFPGRLGPGEAVRIFTGAPVPDGADTILIQENAGADGDAVTALQSEPKGRFVRPKGLDFREGDVLLRAGLRLEPRHVALAAAMNHAAIPVRRRPVIAILATGDELVPPGGDPGPDQIVASNGVGLAAEVRLAGGAPLDLGIVPDRLDDTAQAIAAAISARADVLVTLGGASVGEHDLVRRALADAGMALAFWKIAMRPGKPLIFGRFDRLRVLGLPGNPVSSLVCAAVFLRPLIRALQGLSAALEGEAEASLGRDLAANDERQDYLRAGLEEDRGRLIATPFERQDSSMLATLARADCLVIRPPHAPPARRGDSCRILRLSR
jgi:molybdopterin molybdotransferase